MLLKTWAVIWWVTRNNVDLLLSDITEAWLQAHKKSGHSYNGNEASWSSKQGLCKLLCFLFSCIYALNSFVCCCFSSPVMKAKDIGVQYILSFDNCWVDSDVSCRINMNISDMFMIASLQSLWTQKYICWTIVKKRTFVFLGSYLLPFLTVIFLSDITYMY